MLQTLQWATPTERWVVKAPSHLSALPLVFATYPDARVVMTHRDPLRVVGSLADTMSTLHWMHSNRVAHETLIEFLCMGVELQMNAVTAERDSGTLPVDQIADVLYQDLVADPIGTVTRLYGVWDLELSDEALARLRQYVDGRHVQPGGGRAPLPFRGHRPQPDRAPRPSSPTTRSASASRRRSESPGSGAQACRWARARTSGGADSRPGPIARSCSPRAVPRCRSSWPRRGRSARSPAASRRLSDRWAVWLLRLVVVYR